MKSGRKWVKPLLKGEYSHNIDTKGRLIIPAKMRDDLGENFVITKGHEDCLYVYPEDEWEEFEAKLNKLPITTNDVAREMMYHFVASATDGDIDKQGRTLIPQSLRGFAKLSKEVVFIGMGKRAEIWDKALWEEKNAAADKNFVQNAKQLEAEGFSF